MTPYLTRKLYPALVLVCLLQFGKGSVQAGALLEPVGEEAYELLVSFSDYDRDIPLEGRVVEQKELDHGLRRKVVFRSARGFLVPGFLETPKKGKPPYPCVLLLHGWSGSKDGWWKDRGYFGLRGPREKLVTEGYAVFALDAQGHGDRIAENDYHVVNLYNEPGAMPRKNYFTLRNVIQQTIVDYRRGLDYLATRDEIDMKRIGLLGYSMGGFHAVSLTAVDERIKVAVGCVIPVSLSEDPLLAPANYARGIQNRPFCMLMGKKDPMCNESQARELYKLLEGPQSKIILYDAEHSLPDHYVKDAIMFLKEHL